VEDEGSVTAGEFSQLLRGELVGFNVSHIINDKY
jgi:hypothetical protein